MHSRQSGESQNLKIYPLIIPIFFTTLVFNVSVLSRDQLPFHIDEDKKLTQDDVKNKKEGWYATGLIVPVYDPVIGFDPVGQGDLFYNGKKSDKLYEYQPYKHKISVAADKSTGGQQSITGSWDAPFLNDSPYRVKGEISYYSLTNSQYFGIGEKTLQPLSYRPQNLSSWSPINNASYSDYANAQTFSAPSTRNGQFPAQSNLNYNSYDFETTTVTFSLDKTFLGAFRWVIAPEFSRNIARTFDYPSNAYTGKNDKISSATGQLSNWPLTIPNGQSKLSEDFASGQAKGYGKHGYVNYLHFGLMYDTRDFEPDPSSGIVAEINYSNVSKKSGSNFDFSRYFGQIKFFYMPFPKVFEELVFATRASLTYVHGYIPVGEFGYIWSADGKIDGLGGQQTLRGYRQSRFLGNAMGWGNVETRWRLGTVKLTEDIFTFSLVPFFDLGRVWDKLHDVNSQGYKYSQGIGLRIVWNQASVFLIDYAVSKEDKQLFFNFGQVF